MTSLRFTEYRSSLGVAVLRPRHSTAFKPSHVYVRRTLGEDAETRRERQSQVWSILLHTVARCHALGPSWCLHLMMFQCCSNVYDTGPALKEHCISILCSLVIYRLYRHAGNEMSYPNRIRDVEPILGWSWTNVLDDGPNLTHHCVRMTNKMINQSHY